MKRKRSDDTPRPPAGAAVRQPGVTAALTVALFAEWARHGYGALSLEAVARRAGVGKAALYRRWGSKMAMVIDRLEQADLAIAEVPDTGSLGGDLRTLLEHLSRLLRRPLVRRILPDLHAEMLRSPELAEAIRGRLQVTRRARAAVLLARAVERGELDAEADVELFSDAAGGLLYWRVVVTDGSLDGAYLDELTRFILRGMGAGPFRFL
ncbi:hypothetical protein ABS71_15155 [bacterium SCN 62-11]|mgnify:CR=1 FL=1|nr:TetR/AcrR family transcriptional regulator [Candidatus Eremiobacteraeota bacterium]ODT62831.1 MAG: hypothetical protein ABS71_15155 [bacterium SCN 62-11]